MIKLFFAYLYAFGDFDKTTASNIFDRDTRLGIPNKYNENFGMTFFNVKSESDSIVGKIYSELRYLLSHYFTYFMYNVPEFKVWYNSDFYEMDDELKKRILNTLNTNVDSIRALDSFWLNTQGPYLEARLLRLISRIKKLRKLMDMQNLQYNIIRDELQYNILSSEERNIWLINKAIYIVENLKAGLKNHEDGRFTNVLKNFLTAVVEKKKLDNVFSNLVLSI